MPIQHWTKDTTSQSSWQGTQALAGGISGGIKSLTDSIEAARKERKKESDLTTVLRKKLTVLNPDRKDEFNTMGLNDLTGEDMAHAESVLGEKRKMEMDQFKQRSEAFNADQVDRSRRRADEEGFNRRVREMRKLDPQDPRLGDFYENPENYQTDSYTPQPFDPGQGTANQPYNPQPFNPDEGVARQPNIHYARPQGRITPDQVLDAGAEFNQLGTSQFDNLYNAITRAQGKGELDWEQIKPRSLTTESGKRLFYGKGGQFQFEPEEPGAAKKATVTVPDIAFEPDDKVFEGGLRALPQAERDAAVDFRRKLKQARKTDSGAALMALLNQGEQSPGLFDKIKGWFGGGGGGATNAPAAPADGAPAPGKMTLGADGKYHFTR